MSGFFNPAALMGFGSSLEDDGEVVAVSDDELRRIAGADVRRTCAGLKLASRMVGMAVAGRESVDDGAMLEQMQALAGRMTSLRQAALEVVGVDRGSADFAGAFNVCTDVAMDVLTEEWKWGMIGGEHVMLDAAILKKLLELASNDGPMFADEADAGDVSTIRKLCILEVIPKIWTVVNMFSYYQTNREVMVNRLITAVAEQAEHHAHLLLTEASPTFAERAIVQRMYRVSMGLMCEVYKDAAASDVLELRAMNDLDRSVRLSIYEGQGGAGMPYDHIIARHRAVMDRTLDTTKIIMETQARPREEKGYDDDE